MNELFFITHQTEKYDYLQSVEIALKGGCRQIQLRMKDAFVMEVEKVAWRAKALCDEYGAALYIDDHVGICRKIKAAGVHLGKLDMPIPEARSILGDEYIIGGTANTLEDIFSLYKQGADYMGLGPFRFTTTKRNLSPVLGLEGYRNLIEQYRKNGISTPFVAVGGITIDDIPDIMQTGVAGIALSSTILNAEDPVEETKKIVERLKKNKQ